MSSECKVLGLEILSCNYHPRDVINHYSFNTSPLSDGSGGYEPCPELLTEEQAIRFLRLDETGTKNPSNTLRYYRERGVLRATRIGNGLFYHKDNLVEFIEKQTNKNH